MFNCYICNLVFHEALLNEHHIVPKSAGGTDDPLNKFSLCTGCHQSMHMVAYALMNPKRAGSANDIAMSLFPNAPARRERLFKLALTVAKSFIDKKENVPKSASEAFREEPVTFTIPNKYKHALQLLARETTNPKTGKPMSLGLYLRLVVFKHLVLKLPALNTELMQMLPSSDKSPKRS